jgi:putative transposase
VGKLLSAPRRRACVAHVSAKLDVSERFACKVLYQHRSTQRKAPKTADDEVALTAGITALARQYGRYGYRRITALLRTEGWGCNRKRVERIWRYEGLKVPARQPRRGRLWLNDGSCVRLRPERANHVWAYGFVEDRTRDGCKIRMLNVVDEFTRECLSIRVGRKLPGSPWENGVVESFNGKLRDELLNAEVFNTLLEAQVLIEQWRVHYNTVRPHSSLGYRPPVPEVIVLGVAMLPVLQIQPAQISRPLPCCTNIRMDHPMGAGQDCRQTLRTP